MEKDLADRITYLAQMYFGLSLEICKELAFEFAIQNNLIVPESWNKKTQASSGGVDLSRGTGYRFEPPSLPPLVEQ